MPEQTETPEIKSLRLSVSKVKTLDSCAKKYNYAYNLKLPQKDMDFHIFGKALHLCLENFYSEYIAGTSDPLHVVMNRAFSIAMKEYSSQMTQEAKQEAIDIVKRFLVNIAKQKTSISRAQSVEKNFFLPISGNIILNGMIDRIDMDDDGIYHVADYKTTKNKKYLKDDFFQLLTYAYVIFTEHPEIKKVRGSYILLRHNFEYMTKEFSLDEILEVKMKYETYAKSIEDEKLWRPNPTRLCGFCSYIDICEDGQALVRPKAKHGAVAW